MTTATAQNDQTHVFGFVAYDKPPEQYLEYAHEHDLRHIEIDVMKDDSLVVDAPGRRIQELAERACQLGISLSIHVPYTLNPCEKTDFLRQAHVVYLRKCVNIAARLNATHLTLHMGQFSTLPLLPHYRRQAIDRLIDVLKVVLDDCTRRKVTIALENMHPMPPGSGHGLLGDTADDFERVFFRLHSRYLRFCLDVGHANASDGISAYLPAFAKRLAVVHVSDNKGKTDDHLAIGEGTVPWEQLATRARDAQFTGPWVSECFDTPPHEAIAALRAVVDAH